MLNDIPTDEILLHLFSCARNNNQEIAIDASNKIVYYQTNFKSQVLAIASQFLLNDNLDNQIYQLSAIIISNILRPTEYITNAMNHTVFWKNIDDNIKALIKQGVFRGLFYEDQVIRNTCAHSISLIARLEIDGIHEVLSMIFQIFSNDQYGIWPKFGCLQAITELFTTNSKFDESNPQKFDPQFGSNIFQITITILQSDLDNNFKEAAIKALKASLPYFSQYIISQIESLLLVILSLLQIGQTTYDLLVKFVKLFYNNLTSDIIKLIFDKVLTDMISGDFSKQKNSINFWYKVSKFEYKIYRSISHDKVFHNISKQLSASLDHYLLQFLRLVDEDIHSEDDISSQALLCLQQFSKFPENQEIIAKDCFEYYQQFQGDPDWHIRHSSIISLFIMVAFENADLTVFFIEMIPKLINNIHQETNLKIQYYTILLIGEISSYYFQTLFLQGNLYNLLEISLQFLSQNYEISTATCIMLNKIFENLIPEHFVNESINIFQNLMNMIFERLLPTMIDLFNREDIFQESFFESLLNSLFSLLKSIPQNFFPSILLLIDNISNKLSRLLSQTSYNNTTSQHTMISGMCSLLYHLFKKFSNIPPTYSLDENLAMQLFATTSHAFDVIFYLISSPNNRDALLVISSMIIHDKTNVFKENIEKIVSKIVNIYFTSESQEIITLSGKIIGDIYVLYPSNILNFSPEIIGKTLEYCSDENFLLFYKMQIFQILGDIIDKIGAQYFPYIEETFKIMNCIKSAFIRKTDLETRSAQLKSMMYVSGKILKQYRDLRIINQKKHLLFYGALYTGTEGYQNESLYNTFLSFIEEVLNLPDNIFSTMQILLRRDEIVRTLEDLKYSDKLKFRAKRIQRKIYIRCK